jgi:uncharacterized protein (TIGR02421 family)
MPDRPLAAALRLDRRLSKIAPRIRILSDLEWPLSAQRKFLASWRRKRPALPRVKLEAPSYASEIEALDDLAAQCDRAHPLGRFVARTALSYARAARMMESLGRPAFTQHSIAIYGAPDDRYRTQKITSLDAARTFLDVTDDLVGHRAVPQAPADIPARAFAVLLREALAEFFKHDEVAVVLDPRLGSKAIAGSKRVRLRSGALFSELDLAQLMQHEALVHSATMLNGKKQPRVRTLALGAPRTTRTQEGIAVFAELVTLSIDLARLRRVALRVCAVQRALEGGDFVDVFRYFLEAGQTEEESYASAQRIFRGGDVRGKVAFTKDCVYLKGLLEVHTFLRAAIRDGRPELVRHLFAGRLTLGDAVELAPLFDSGVLAEPVYVPPFALDIRRLAALLAYSGFMDRVDLGAVSLENFVAAERAADEAGR